MLGPTELDAAPPTVVLERVHQLPRQHPVAAYLRGLGAGSRRAMLSALHTIARAASDGALGAWSLEWWRLRYEDTQIARARVVEHYPPASARKIVSALRGILRECKKLGLMARDEYLAAVDLDSIEGESEPRGRHLAPQEQRAMFTAAWAMSGARGARNVALLGVALQTGARRSEIVALDVGDYERAGGRLRFRKTKRKKEREGHMHDEARDALDRWLELRGGGAVGAMFVAISKTGRVLERRLSDRGYYEMLVGVARAAGLDHVTTHDLRKTFGGSLLDRGADLSTVQQLLGHSSPATTARYYDRRPAETRRRAARLAQVPAAPPGAPAENE
jgi:integrase